MRKINVMIGPVNLKFFSRDMLSETGSSMKEAGFKFPHEQRSERTSGLIRSCRVLSVKNKQYLLEYWRKCPFGINRVVPRSCLSPLVGERFLYLETS